MIRILEKYDPMADECNGKKVRCLKTLNDFKKMGQAAAKMRDKVIFDVLMNKQEKEQGQ